MTDDQTRPDTSPDSHPNPGDARSTTRANGRAAAAARMAQQSTWVDQQIRQAMERGDFDDLPGAGKPIEGLGASHDPDWWVKKLVEREHVALLPASIQLRRDDAELDDRLDGLGSEKEVRREVEDFNSRVIAARYRAPQGPPLITMPRDVADTVSAWVLRREARHAEQRAQLAAIRARDEAARAELRGRRWWRRSR